MTGHAFSELVAAPERGRVFTLSQRPGLGDCAPWGGSGSTRSRDGFRTSRTSTWRTRGSRRARYGSCGAPGCGSGASPASVSVDRADDLLQRHREDVGGAPHDGGPRDTGQSRRRSRVAVGPPRSASRRPAPFNDLEIATYGDAADGRRVTARLRHPTPDALEARRKWQFRATEADVADHINNAAYWQPLEEELLAGAEPAALDVEIEFRSPAQPGEKLFVRSGRHRWIVDPAGELHASIAIGEQTPAIWNLRLSIAPPCAWQRRRGGERAPSHPSKTCTARQSRAEWRGLSRYA